MRKGFISDLGRGAFLGVISCAWLGYLIGLRILNWNPYLWDSVSNIAGALIFITLLYVILGLIVGVLFSLGLKIVFIPFSKNKPPEWFTIRWLLVYSAITVLLFIYLTITRTHPEAHVLIYDVPLVVVYVISLLVFFVLIWKIIIRGNAGIIRASALPMVIFGMIALGVSYVNTSLPETPAIGDWEEIEEALAASNSEAKVFLFAIDGAEWGIIDKLVSQGRMPVMAELMSKGARVNFKSLSTLKSPLIWNSMATGKLPEKHGILDFCCFRFPLMKSSFINYPDGIGFYRLVSKLLASADIPVTSTTRKVEAIWDILTKADKTVGVVGWWATWPADEVNGVMISDRFTYTLFNPRASANTLREGQVYPPEMLDKLTPFVRLPQDMTDEELSRFVRGKVEGDVYPVEWELSGYKEWNPIYQLKMGYTSGESFFNASMYLLNIKQPDFFTVYLEGNDMVSHYFWQYMDPSLYPDSIPQEDFDRYGEVVERYYCYWDSLLGEALNLIEEGTDIIIASDHGFGRDPKPKTPFRGGEHLLMGVFFGAGPHFKAGYSAKDASVLDLTPTLLYLYDLPLGEDMDGEVMLDVFKDEFTQSRPVEYIKSYETGRRARSRLVPSSADEQIKQQLRSLGYTK